MLQCLDCAYNTENKFNFKRHSLSKHQKIINNKDLESLNLNNEASNLNILSLNLNNEASNLNNLSLNLNNEASNLNNESSNFNNILPNQCEKCHKIYSSQKCLTVHLKICKGINNKECQFCQKEFSTKQSVKRHELICKEKGKNITIINNNTNNTNIQNIDNTVNNIDNSVTNNIIHNTIVFNMNNNETIKFDVDHITPEVLIKIFKKSINNHRLMCSKLLDTLWDNVNNRCITKPNIKTNFSKVSGENGTWLSGLDLDILPKFIKDGFKTSTMLIEKYKSQLLKLMNEDKYDEAYIFLDEMETVEIDDKPKSQIDMDDDNYFYGNSKEDSARINKFQEIDNERIEEFQHSYKRYRLKAHDNKIKLIKK